MTPRLAHDHVELARVAADLRDQRAAGDPPLVEAGKLTADQAAARLRIAAAVAADWRRVVEGGERPPVTATEAEKLAMLDGAARVTRDRANRARDRMVDDRGPWTMQTDRGALWHLCTGNIEGKYVILPFLKADHYAAAVEALLWWQRLHVDGGVGIQLLTDINRDWHGDRPAAREAA